MLDDITYTKDHEINGPKWVRPHIFVLGAGASRAACPTGDASGKSLPVMNDLVNLLRLENSIPQSFLDDQMNFETIYSSIFNSGELELAEEIEVKVTVYDYLI